MDKVKVLKDFRDKEDKNAKGESRSYVVGDDFPATKRKVPAERLEYLQGLGYVHKPEAE